LTLDWGEERREEGGFLETGAYTVIRWLFGDRGLHCNGGGA